MSGDRIISIPEGELVALRAQVEGLTRCATAEERAKTKALGRAEAAEATVSALKAELEGARAQIAERGGVAVKALEWSQKAPPAHDHEPFVYWAAGLGGHYRAEPDGLLWMAHDAFVWEQHSSQAAAKSAAQADYERRILSALAPSERRQVTEAEAAEIEKAFAELETFSRVHGVLIDSDRARLTDATATLRAVIPPAAPAPALREEDR